MRSLDEAWTRLQDGDPGAAALAFAEAASADPRRPDPWIGLAHARRALGDWRGVADALDGLVKHGRDRALARQAALARGHALDRQVGDLTAARRAYEAALQLDPALTGAYLALAELDLRTNQWNLAFAHATHGLEGADALAPERPWLHLCRAVGRKRSSLSMGPVSSFFRGLSDTPSAADPARAHGTRDPRAPAPDPGAQDIALALAALPRLRALLPADPLADPIALARLVCAEMPRPGLPAPRS